MESQSLLVRWLPLWIILAVIAGFLIRWYIRKTDKEREESIVEDKPDTKHFFLKLLAVSLLQPLLLIFIQRWLEMTGRAPASLLAYVPYILVCAGLLSIIFFRKVPRASNLTGDSRLYRAIGIVFTLLFPPCIFLTQYREFTESVKKYDPAVTTTPIRSAFVSIQNPKLRYDKILDFAKYTSRSRDDEDIYELKYYAIIPLNNSPMDTILSTWVYMSDTEKISEITAEADQEKAHEDFRVKRRESAKQFDPSRVVYYSNDLDQRLDMAWRMLKVNNLLNDRSVVLNPSTKSLSENRNSTLIAMGVIYLIIIIPTWGLLKKEKTRPAPPLELEDT